MILNQELKENLVHWAETRGDVDLMIIFGSRAKDRQRPDSDLDLGIWRSIQSYPCNFLKLKNL